MEGTAPLVASGSVVGRNPKESTRLSGADELIGMLESSTCTVRV